MIYNILFILLGFVALIGGAHSLVNGASNLAKKWGISELFIGLTIVAFGTSFPELVVNVVASIDEHDDLILGNILGSNNFNLFMILGSAGIIYPIVVKSKTAWREIPISLAATILVLLVANDYFIGTEKYLSRFDGAVLLIAFIAFLVYVFRGRHSTEVIASEKIAPVPSWKTVLLIVIGFAGLILGGHLVVNNSVELASNLGISEKVIGLTIVAAGTSLPEWVTSVVAALKRNSDIAIGNVIGSNIFNLLLILPVSLFVNPFRFSPAFNQELAILIGGTLFVLVAMLTGGRKKLDRWEAVILMLFFISYTSFLIL